MSAETKTRRKIGKFRLSIFILMALTVLIGIVMVVYPFLDVWKAEREVKQEIQVWREQMLIPSTSPATTATEEDSPKQEPTEEPVSTEPTPLDALRQTMEQMNREIYLEGQAELADAFDLETPWFDLSQYGIPTDIYGVISIPKINVELPLYLGASEEHLSKGFAQISQTSFPVGGNNTNCVVACHRGWRGMAYMRDCELLGKGDSLFLENPWETLEYRLAEVIVVNPWETEPIYIQAGRDLITVVTCHPYGVGSHRYVMFFERYCPDAAAIETEPEKEKEPVPKTLQPTSPELVVGWGNTITVTTSESVDFVSSQMEIFWRFYFPWMCIAAICLLFGLALVLWFISWFIRTVQRHRNGGQG